MKTLSFLLLAMLLFISANARASGFDCRKAAMPSDFVVCSSPDLLKANDALAASWFAARAKLDAVGKAALVKDQRAWLKFMTSDCDLPEHGRPDEGEIDSAQSCVQKDIQDRTEVLAWMAETGDTDLKKLTTIHDFLTKPVQDISSGEYKGIKILDIACWASKYDPQAVERVFITGEYGQLGRFAPICPDWQITHRLPALSPLLQQYADLSGEFGPIPCYGSRIIDKLRSWAQLEWQAAIDIEPESANDLAKETLDFPESVEHWSQQGVIEKNTYQKILSMRSNELSIFKKYYIMNYKISENYARQLSIYYLNRFAYAYLNAAPRDPAAFAAAYENGVFTVDDVHKFLGNSDSNKRKYSTFALEKLLNLAIVNDFSISDIKKILTTITSNIPQNTSVQLYPLYPSADGANFNSQETALMKAAFRSDVLAELLKTGIWDVNTQNWFGKTALMYAIQFNDQSSIDMLLSAKADPNLATFPITQIPDDYCKMNQLKAGNRTPLMYAAWHSTPDIIARLLHAGANPRLADDRGHTASDYLKHNDDDLSKPQLAMAASLLASH